MKIAHFACALKVLSERSEKFSIFDDYFSTVSGIDIYEASQTNTSQKNWDSKILE